MTSDREKAIREKALEILRDLRRRGHTVWDKPPEPLDVLNPSLAARELYGYRVREVPEIPEQRRLGGPEAAAGLLDPRLKEILVATDNAFNEGARRFTQAHELGHLVLHADDQRHFRDRPGARAFSSARDPKGELEREAHVFASEFLMPAPLLHRWFKRQFECECFDDSFTPDELASRIRLKIGTELHASDIEGVGARDLARLVARSLPFDREAPSRSLAEIFRVSIEAMAIQLQDVGLVTVLRIPIRARSPVRTQRFDVFMCYSSRDDTIVQQIARKLRVRGIVPWLDKFDLRPGMDWIDALQELINRIDAMAVFVGREGIGPWQDIEVKAIIRQVVKRGCRVIPVLLPRLSDDPELPIFLQGFQVVDFRLLDPDPMERLTWGITGDRVDREPVEQ